MSFKRLTLVVPVAEQTNANQKAKQFGRNTDDATFTVPLSPDGNPPATHFISCWGGLIDSEFGQLRAQIGGIPGGRAVATPNSLEPEDKEDPDDLLPEELLAEMGLQPVETDEI